MDYFLISCGTGNLLIGNNGTLGWIVNSKESFVLYVDGKCLKINEAFYVDPSFTSVMDSAGYSFTT